MATARTRTPQSDIPPGLVSQLVDEMLSAYVVWREDEAAVGAAHARWSGAPSEDESWRFAAYMAALDQEESSAKRYAVVVRDVERWLQ